MSEEIKKIQDDEIDLRDLILTLWKGKWIILCVTVLITVVAYFYVKSLPDKYTVVTNAVIPSSSGSSKMSGLAALAGVDMGSGDVDLMKHVDVIVKNSYFMDRLLERKWLVEKDSVTLEQFFEMRIDSSEVDWEYRHRMIMYSMLRSSKKKFIEVSNDLGVLSLKTQFTSPELAYQVNVVLKELLIDYFQNTYKTQDSEKVSYLKSRLDETKKRLTQSENKLVAFKKKNIVSSSPLKKLEEERLSREVGINLELYKETVKQYEFAKAEAKENQPIFEVIQEPELPIYPSAPNRKMLQFISLFVGLFAGFVVVLFCRWISMSKLNNEETNETN